MRSVLDQIKESFKVQRSHFQPEFMINCIEESKKVVEIPLDYLPRKGTSKITGSLFKTIKLGIVMAMYIVYRRLRGESS